LATDDYHVPVLAQTAISYLIHNPDGIYADATCGGGGHGELILRKLSKRGTYIGIDRDQEAIQYCQSRLKPFGDQVLLFQAPFSQIKEIIQNAGGEVLDGMLLDLGISSHQIDVAARGFSYLNEGPLDMRMGTQDHLTAAVILNTYPEKELADIFYHYGEEKKSRSIARRIIESRTTRPLSTTSELALVIQSCIAGPANKTLSRIFQALRIAVNDEINELKIVLQNGGDLLRTGGRMVVISYHSLEDRLVKRFFKGEILSTERMDMVEKA
jgi:16S rRNA (cytosine1402-N4)-methyltransferase